MTDKMPLDALIPFESADEDDNYRYQTLFDDQPKELGVLVSPLCC